jgi:ferric-dicitrate binding protein FerR (iron transport regulator)
MKREAMKSTSELNQWFDAYAEGELSAGDAAALAGWLRESPAHVDSFVRETFLHSELFSLARQQCLHEGVLQQSGLDAAATGVANSDAPHATRRPTMEGGRRFRGWALAAAALVAAMMLWGAWSVLNASVVGQLTQATADAVWQHQSDALKAGEFLREGQRLQLVRGRALVTLGSGARIVVEGPATLSVVNDNRIRLEKGRLGATVPTQAIGFTVDTAFGEFVDLGTEFTLDLSRASTCELHVFTGMVEVRPQQDKTRGRQFQVAQTQAVSYNPATDVAEPITIDAAMKLEL